MQERGVGPFQTPHGGEPLLQNELVAKVAKRRGITPAQVRCEPAVSYTALQTSARVHTATRVLLVRSSEARAHLCGHAFCPIGRIVATGILV